MSRTLIILTFGLFGLCFSNVSWGASEAIPFEQYDTISANKNAHTTSELDYFTIASVEIREVNQDNQTEKMDKSDDGTSNWLGDIVLIVDQLMAMGKKVWTVIDAGRPVVTAKFKPISVLPYLAQPEISFLSMSNWSIPKVQQYEVVYKNVYGGTVVNFSFMVTFQHDGAYKGIGKYLTGVNIIPSNISVAWGYKFDCKSELMAISNLGTLEGPLAGATIQLDYITSTPLKESRSSIIFHIVGDGRLIKL
ncbi:MAG: hypothetical protein A2381_05955 [Bdellovibrionales bacterium RIFOXYB1_FULL_37_110]|nr:MAG: hypothetical protein A2417_04840 [Bdellovibrionales bacterium RIFOXYC1_FULL_37_79]OFZ59364.1 MAG: hypothetical protein A2381_05955 [Bdellovibrionales bacterium RIFOXYB1_FULL_37_110]OFZ61924.1 MAG: hypothetical protein A2577_17840 [Bdellovibrionales bacterium RIFOXYD1_FULL_36_51]